MSFKRINGRIDIDSEIAVGGIRVDEEEQRGARPNKFWFNEYKFMYKDIYPLTYEDYAEVFAYKLAEYLDVECAEYDFAIHNGNYGVITKNLIKDSENEELLTGREIISEVYAEYIEPIIKAMEKYQKLITMYSAKNIREFSQLSKDEKEKLSIELVSLVKMINIKNEDVVNRFFDNNDFMIIDMEKVYNYLDSFVDIYSQDFSDMKHGIIKANNLYDIWNILEIYSNITNGTIDVEESMNDLINMFIFDIITSQGDRHADNWAIIKNNKDNSLRMCPLFDNSNICSLNRRKASKSIIDYNSKLSDPNLSDKKRERLIDFLNGTINHSISGLKVDSIDVDKNNKNKTMIEKFITFSSQEFDDRLMRFVGKINPDLISEIFDDIEIDTNIVIPKEVKDVVNVVIMHNIEMIKEVHAEKGKER